MANFGIWDIPVDINKTVWCVFGHYSVGGQPIYYGYCKLEHVLNTKQFETGVEWYNTVIETGGQIIISILSLHNSEQSAADAKNAKLMTYTPASQGDSFRGRGFIRCIDTGMYFSTAGAAARYNDMTSATMSNHLNGRAGYDTVRGLRFERVGTALPHDSMFIDGKGVQRKYIAERDQINHTAKIKKPRKGAIR